MQRLLCLALYTHNPLHDGDLALFCAQVASILSGTVYFTMTLTCGFIIPAPNFPGWWIWYVI